VPQDDVVPEPTSLPEPEPGLPSVVAIGVFDGVHRGHQVVIGRAAERARAAGVRCVVITFDPNPADVVGRGDPLPRLSSVPRRVELLQAAGADEVWVLPFTRELSQLAPEQFVEEVLVPRLAPVAVVVGADFRFGHRAAGDPSTLRELGERLGFEVEAVGLTGRGPEAQAAGHEWSSTSVRRLLVDGDVAGAAEVLSRPHRVEGRVVHGDHRGRDLGFPTANLEVDARAALPADGVYAGVLQRADGTRLPAAVSVGTNPTFGGTGRRVEAYVIDAPPDLDLYAETVGVDLVARLRGMERFDDVDALVAQMARDVEQARERLG
jgi:riboflavin kinase/FMN adenylyltransferase